RFQSHSQGPLPHETRAVATAAVDVNRCVQGCPRVRQSLHLDLPSPDKSVLPGGAATGRRGDAPVTWTCSVVLQVYGSRGPGGGKVGRDARTTPFRTGSTSTLCTRTRWGGPARAPSRSRSAAGGVASWAIRGRQPYPEPGPGRLRRRTRRAPKSTARTR